MKTKKIIFAALLSILSIGVYAQQDSTGRPIPPSTNTVTPTTPPKTPPATPSTPYTPISPQTLTGTLYTPGPPPPAATSKAEGTKC